MIISKLKKKTVLIVMASVNLVMLLMVVGMNLVNYQRTINDLDETLIMIGENQGRYPKPGEGKRPEAAFSTRYFSVLYDVQGHVISVDVINIHAISSENAIKMASDVILSSKKSGFLSEYRYLKVSEGTMTRIIFLDSFRSLEMFYSFLKTSLMIAGFSLVGVLLLALFFTKIFLKPIEEAFLKQREFVTNASHELKTPITIIKANMEVLSLDYSENKWIDSTTRQTDRMNKMVENLLFLSKMDEDIIVDLSKTYQIDELLNNVINDFNPMLEELFNLRLKIDKCEKKIDGLLIIKLFNSLIENAYNYGINFIEITLNTKGEKFEFIISNETEETLQGDLSNLLDRFTRLDKARSQKHGGSGIGLSVADSIVKLHHGKIQVKGEGNIFTVIVEI